MSTDRPVHPPNSLLATGLVGFVVACGFGGMFFGKHILHTHAAVKEVAAAPDTEPTLDKGSAEPSRTATAKLNQPPGSALTSAVKSPQAAPTETAPEPAVTESTAVDAGVESPGQVTEDKEIGLALQRWQNALLTNDSAQIAPSYAAHVNRYFLRTQVSRSYVRDYMERDEERGTRLTKYELHDMSIDHVKRDEVEVHFVANFAVSTPTDDKIGQTRTLLMLRREDGDWKIFYERDLKS